MSAFRLLQYSKKSNRLLNCLRPRTLAEIIFKLSLPVILEFGEAQHHIIDMKQIKNENYNK